MKIEVIIIPSEDKATLFYGDGERFGTQFAEATTGPIEEKIEYDPQPEGDFSGGSAGNEDR